MRYQRYMVNVVRLFAGVILCLFRTRRELLLENPVLRQQRMLLKRRHPKPRLAAFDKLFWVLTRRCWPGWKRALIVVTTETVARWHQAGFRLYWKVIQSAKTDGAKTDSSGSEGIDFPYGRGEPHLGSAAYSRGATHAGLRCF